MVGLPWGEGVELPWVGGVAGLPGAGDSVVGLRLTVEARPTVWSETNFVSPTLVPEQPAAGVGDFIVGLEEDHRDAGGDVRASFLFGRACFAELLDDAAGEARGVGGVGGAIVLGVAGEGGGVIDVEPGQAGEVAGEVAIAGAGPDVVDLLLERGSRRSSRRYT